MSNLVDLEYEIRSLLENTKPDKKWFQKTEKLLGLQRFALQSKDPLKELWSVKWGALQHVKQQGEKGLAWHRTDGANPIALIDKTTLSLKVARLSLLARLVKVLKDKDQLSFIKMGHPKNWQQYKVTVDGNVLSHIIEADALLGICVVAKDGEQGVSIDKEGKLDSTGIRGHVEIKRNQENLGSFF